MNADQVRALMRCEPEDASVNKASAYDLLKGRARIKGRELDIGECKSLFLRGRAYLLYSVSA